MLMIISNFMDVKFVQGYLICFISGYLFVVFEDCEKNRNIGNIIITKAFNLKIIRAVLNRARIALLYDFSTLFYLGFIHRQFFLKYPSMASQNYHSHLLN